MKKKLQFRYYKIYSNLFKRKRINLNFDQSETLEDFYLNNTWFPHIDELQILSSKNNMTEVELKVNKNFFVANNLMW